MTGYPDNNPKTAIGVTKVPLHLVPPSAKHFLAMALADGAKKYGPYNWRDASISVSVYKSALERHMDAFWDGEDSAPDSGIHHVAHAMACCALILDALTLGKLNDDRPTTGASARLQTAYAKVIPHEVAKLMQRDGLVPNCGLHEAAAQGIPHHATEAPMPPHLAGYLDGREDDTGDEYDVSRDPAYAVGLTSSDDEVGA